MAWLGTWSKRLKLTIDQTKVDTANQSNFPVLVHLSAASGIGPVDVSCIFDELISDANRKKIVVTTSDGTTQCYVEIEDWDDASEKALLWVKVPTVAHAADTDLYIYYDSSQADNTTYVGDVGSTPGQTVWDLDFICVYHFEEKTGVLKDSTANGHDGTTVGFSEAERTNVGKIGNAFDFNEAEWISLPDHADFKPDLATVEAVCKTGVAGGGNAYPRIFDRYDHPDTGYNLAAGDPNGKGQIELRLTGGEQRTALTAAVIENDGSWHSLAGSYEDNHTKMYDDGDLDNDTVGGAGKVIIHKTVQVPYIGYGAIHNKPYKGLICEIRTSKITRSAAWIKATYYSNEDNLITFGAEEIPSSFDIVADPIEVTLDLRGLFSQWPARPRDPALDQIYDCHGQDRFGNWNQGVIQVVAIISGGWLNKTIFADSIEVTASQLGGRIGGVMITADPIMVTAGMKSADITLECIKFNWLKWSNIGNLDFTIGKDNIAGERPLDWRGWIYAIKKLGNRVIVYGQNGVSALIPSGNTYGLNTIYRIGLKGKQAVAGDDGTHYFIDNKGQLWRLSEGLEKLDYSEYLSALSNPVLSWDVANSLLYICDGTLGYVYSADSGSLGAGPVNVSGIGSQTGTLYAVSPATIVTPTFQICSDIMDLGTRKGKNIYSLEIGTDLTEIMEAAIDYRIDKAAAFATTDWYVVDPRGIVFIPVYGQEFRFRFKSDVYSYIEVEPIIVRGEVCNY